MQALSNSLMAGLLLIQALTGLCCYHARAAACCETSAVAKSDVPDCCQRKKQKTPPQKAPSVPCPRCECMGFCTYVQSDKVELDFPQLVLPFDLLIPAQISADSQFNSPSFWIAATHPPAAGPPLRLHLLHQIILI
jgi:hypothetical protein